MALRSHGKAQETDLKITKKQDRKCAPYSLSTDKARRQEEEIHQKSQLLPSSFCFLSALSPPVSFLLFLSRASGLEPVNRVLKI